MNENIDLKNSCEENEADIVEKTIELEKKKSRGLMKKALFFLLFCATVGYFFSRTNISSQNSTAWYNRIPLLNQIKYLAEGSDKPLKGEKNGRINILLLGMGGKKHEGGYLTDTIMLASLDLNEKKAALISIPRDLTIPIEGEGWKKINNINAYAEMKEVGGGGLAVSQAVADILDIPIDYYIRVDFEGFINIINKLGGIEVNVENSFNDYRYPIMGQEDAEPYESRYEHLYFEQGLQTMDGELALKYARSRHAYGVEGSDFARAKRQQKIIEAAKAKILATNFFFQPNLILSIMSELEEHISANLKVWEIIKLWNMFKNIDSTAIINKTLNNGPDGLLINSVGENGAYILSPKSGDFTEIQYLIKNIFVGAPVEIKTKIIGEKSSIDVRNGTWINGLASKYSLDLEQYGFEVIRIGNSSQRNFENSVIYDLTYGEKTQSLSVLKEKTGANVSLDLPKWLADDLKTEVENGTIAKPDFILILGRDTDTTNSGAINTME